MGEWRECTLDEVYDFGSGLSKSADQFGFGYGFVGFKDVFYNSFLPDQLSQLVNSTEKERVSCSVKAGDVFLTRTSETQEELGMSSVALKDYPNATFNGFTKRLRPKGDIEVVPEYAAYYFRSPLFRRNVTSMSSITTRASLNNEMLSALTIRLPGPTEQRAIGSCLKSLDAKIDLLHRQNKTLEAMAETLFRQWFVERRPEDLEGEAEEGWEEGTLADVAMNIRDGVQVGAFNADDRYVALEHIDRRRIALQQYGSSADVASNKYRFRANDILFGKLRPYFHKVCLASFAGICSTDVLVIRPKRPELLYYCLFAFFQDDVVEFANAGSGGTRMPRTSWSDLSQYGISLPSGEKLNEFNNVVKPMMDKLQENIPQTATLTVLRDMLLPKLMSGEVRVELN